MSFEFQFQALNVFNHSQYIAGSLSTVNAIGYTNITDFVTIGGATFNQPQNTFANNARTVQLAAKFTF
jgi:hypothetical protein